MGNEQQNEGRLEQARGTVKEAIGDATDNERMQREGAEDLAEDVQNDAQRETDR